MKIINSFLNINTSNDYITCIHYQLCAKLFIYKKSRILDLLVVSTGSAGKGFSTAKAATSKLIK